jgi:ribose transport system permease protein
MNRNRKAADAALLNEPFSKVVLRYITETEIKNYLTPIIGTILLFIIGQIVVPGFTSVTSIFNYFALASLTMYACIGQSLVILSGNAGIDLSIGALMSLGAAWGGALSGGTTIGVVWSVILIGAIGAMCGLLSGASAQYLSMPAMVVTMSMGNLVSGAYLAITKGQPAGTSAPILKTIGTENAFWHIRWVLIIAIACIIIMELVLRKTKYGKSLYLVGTNSNASGLIGIKTQKTVVMTYALAGMSAAVAGILLFAVVGSMQSNMGNDYTMLAVASVVIGGTSIAGGKGTYFGAILGAIMLTVLTGFLTVIQIPEGARNCIKGLILLSILLAYARSPKLRQ